MRDSIYIGSVPCDEPCAQVGSEHYRKIGKFECYLFIKAIIRELGKEPEGAHLTVKSNMHEFGIYYAVECVYDTEDEEATEYAYECEGNTPANWSDEERKELSDFKRRFDPYPSPLRMTVGDVLAYSL